MRILYVWDADYPWDVRTEKVCFALTEHGHEVHIAARNRMQNATTESLPEGTVHRMRAWRWAGKKLNAISSFPAFCNPRWISHLSRITRTIKPDRIIVRDLPLCPAAIWVGRRYNVPVIMDMAENYPAMIRQSWDAGRQKRFDFVVRNPKLAQRVEKWCLPRCDAIIAVVEENAQRLIRMGVPRDRVVVVSNTPPSSRVPPVPRGARDVTPLDIVYLGLMELPRGIGEVLEAIAVLRDRGVHMRLRAVGVGRDLPVFLEQAKRLGLGPDHAEFLGRLEPHSAALDVIASGDIGVMPHYNDEAWETTVSNKLFDYMAVGLPVLASDAAPVTRILGETGAGVLFEARNVDSIVGGLLSLQDPATRQRMGEAGRRAVLEQYNWESDTAVLLDVVESTNGQIAQIARTRTPATLEASA